MPVRHAGTPREALALATLVKLMRATESVAAELQRGLAGTGLTPGQLGVLEALLHLGPMHACELGRKLLRSNANMTTVLDNLERAGLVTRTRGRDDRRFVTIELTTEGRRLIERVFPLHAARVADAFQVLTAAEQEELGRLCRKLGTSIVSGGAAAEAASPERPPT